MLHETDRGGNKLSQSYYTIDFEKLPSNVPQIGTVTLTVGHRPLQYTYAIYWTSDQVS
jgi:hypothetical protein